MTIVEVVESLPTKKGIAMINRTDFRRFEVSYKELYGKILKTCSLLEEHKVKKGDRIMIWGRNCPEWGIVFLAAAIKGIVIVPVDYMAKCDHFNRIYDIVKPKLVFHSSFMIVPKVKAPKIVLRHLDQLLLSFKPFNGNYPTIEDDDLLEIVFTSGTTGDPKGVMLTHDNVVSNLTAIRRHINLTGKRTFLSLLPLSHLFEQNPGFLLPLSLGSTIVYISSLKPHMIFKALDEESITNIIVVPRLLKLFANNILRKVEEKGRTGLFNRMLNLKIGNFLKKKLFRSVHRKFGRRFDYFVVGGAPLSEELESFWNKLGFKVVQGYGLTECSPVLTVNSIDYPKQGSVGKVLPGVEMKFIDGEILVRGPNITKGYYQDEKKTKALFDDGWMKTEDVGSLDAEGFLFLKGRKKDMIVTESGVNVFPSDIEAELLKNHDVKEACVLGVPTKSGEEVHAEIILKNKSANVKRIVEEANKRLNSSQQIISFSLWLKEDFPRTPTLKIKKRFVLQEIRKRSKKKTEVKSSGASFFYMVLSELSKKSASEIKPDKKLGLDLKLTSVDRVELVSMLEQEYNLDIDEEEITSQTTVGDLEKIVAERKSRSYKDGFHRWLLWPPIVLLRLIFGVLIQDTLIRIFCRRKVIGKGNLNDINQPVIFISNHIGYLDAPNIVMTLPLSIRGRVAPAAFKEYFDVSKENIFKRMLFGFYYCYASLIMNIYLFPKERGFKRSLEYTGELLNKGSSVLFFPEGRHSLDGTLQPFKSGIGLLVKEMRIPVVPIKISGIEGIMKGSQTLPGFGRVRIKIGKPVVLDYTKSIPEITAEARDIIVKM